MSAIRSSTLGGLLVCLALCAACSRPTDSAEAVAHAFVDRLFVEADQQRALPLTEGLARAKVEEEIRLLGDQPRTANDERPRVYYRQLSEQTDDKGRTFYFQLTVMVIGDQPVEPELIVRVRPNGKEWHVSNYEVTPPRRRTPAPSGR